MNGYHKVVRGEKKLEKYELSSANIMIADLICFTGYNDKDQLVSAKMRSSERFRKVYFIEGRYFDLETNEEYFPCEISDDGLIYGPIFVNTLYVTRTYRPKTITYQDTLRAALLFNSQLKRDELIAKRKVILLPRERLL